MSYTPGQIRYFTKSASRRLLRDRRDRLNDGRAVALAVMSEKNDKAFASMLKQFDAFDKEL